MKINVSGLKPCGHFTQICTDPADLWPTIAHMLADPDEAIRASAASLLDGRTTDQIAMFSRRYPWPNRDWQLMPEKTEN